ncbi:MAG: hypothetical protein PVF89_07540 [Lysobacterales bacterium]|jgi:hypothetical protein
MPYYISPPPQNPLTRILAAIFVALALTGAFMLGMAALIVVAGLGLVAGLVLWARIAWIRRALKKQGIDPATGRRAGRTTAQDDVIEAEYTVVSKRKD